MASLYEWSFKSFHYISLQKNSIFAKDLAPSVYLTISSNIPKGIDITCVDFGQNGQISV